jgi:hypothetical protein
MPKIVGNALRGGFGLVQALYMVPLHGWSSEGGLVPSRPKNGVSLTRLRRRAGSILKSNWRT